MTVDDVLDEIKALPLGEVISDASAEFIWEQVLDGAVDPRSDYGKLMLDNFRFYESKKPRSLNV